MILTHHGINALLLEPPVGPVYYELVTITSGSLDPYNYIPVATNKTYSIANSVYPASDIGTAGKITDLEYYIASNYIPSATRTVSIYMLHTSDSASTSTIPQVQHDNLVYSGELSLNEAGWTKMHLDTPFEYNGSSNLRIIVVDNTGSTSSKSVYFRYIKTTNISSVSYKNGSTAFDPEASAIYSASTAPYKLETRFTFQKPVQYETIGGKQYRVIKIGSTTWMWDNLDYTYTGGSYTNSQHPEYGKYYTSSAARSVANSISGWRLPTRQEVYDLCTRAGLLLKNDPDNANAFYANNSTSTNSKDNYTAENRLCAVGDSVWPDATDELNFSALRSGLYDSSAREFVTDDPANFRYVGTTFWAQNPASSSGTPYRFVINPQPTAAGTLFTEPESSCCYNLRLVKSS